MTPRWICIIAAVAILAVPYGAVIGADLVEVESKTVTKGETAVPIAVSLENDLPVNAFTFTFLVRTIAGEAYWTNVPASLDTLPWYGRAANALTTFRFLRKDADYIDGISPDKFMIAGQKVFESPIAVGPLEPIITFVCDVNSSIGQFMIDTAFYEGNHLIYVDDTYYTEVALDFNPGVITIPAGDHMVKIGSKSVPTSSTGVEVGIMIANDDPLQRITLPLICRNLTGGAFWTDVPASLDTLPWSGRLTSALTHTRILDKSNVDGVSPDPFLLTAQNDTDPPLAAGPLENMITLVFDVGDDGGSFEIDSALFSPDFGLEVETPGDPGLVITPEFTKGVITAVLPDTGNQVIIGSVSVQAKEPGVVLPVQITTTTKMWTISIPLTARSLVGDAFWASDFDTTGWFMTPPNALSYTRHVIKQFNFDYVSPDDFLIWAKSFPGQDPCLETGEYPSFLGLCFTVNENPGTFEIDTIWLPPNRTLYFGLCDEVATVEPSFTKGIVTIRPCDCSLNGDFNCDGARNPLDVVLMVNFVYLQLWMPPCDPGSCFQNCDINCDGVINPVDLVLLVNFVYLNLDPPCDPCTM